MPYTDNVPHAGSAEVLATGMYDEFAGTLARTLPRGQITANNVALSTTGIPVVRSLPLPAGLPITNLTVYSGSTAEITGSHFWAAVMDVNSNVIAVTADNTGATFVTATTKLTVPVINGPVLVPQTGLYYGVVGISAATMPTLCGGANAGGLPSGFGAVAPVLCGTLASQPTPPAVGQNLGAITASGINFGFWVS